MSSVNNSALMDRIQSSSSITLSPPDTMQAFQTDIVQQTAGSTDVVVPLVPDGELKIFF
jgi:hypothetical protein